MNTNPNAVTRGGRRRAPVTALEIARDERLVEDALRGRREAFEALVRRHHKPLVSYLHRLTGGREGAADLAQEVFIKVYQSLASFDPRYRFTTWLYRIASNCAIDHLRRKQVPTCSLSQPSTDGSASLEPRLGDGGPTPHDFLRLRELERRLDAEIAELPLPYRQLLLLRHRQHCRYDEIARITRLPIGTVKNRIFRAREMLRVRLADLLDAGA